MTVIRRRRQGGPLRVLFVHSEEARPLARPAKRTCVYIYREREYLYIYIEREREIWMDRKMERERERDVYIHIRIYVFMIRILKRQNGKRET